MRARGSEDVSSWDMTRSNSGLQISSQKLAFNQLMWNPRSFEIECDLCANYEWQGNGSKIVFHLRKDVKFHDGRPLTSADVVWSLNLKPSPSG